MTQDAYSRKRIEDVLTKAELPPSSRIVPHRYLETPLGVTPADSRFSSRADGFAVLYASPEFATAFIETIVRDRFTRRDQREVLLKEVTERAWARITTKPRARLSL